MAEKEIKVATSTVTATATQEPVSAEEHQAKLLEVVTDIILEFKKSGSITTDALFDKLEKYQATPSELEEIYKTIDDAGIQIINEYERDKDLYLSEAGRQVRIH
jgi:KaiC/GvpD/RAD55 family RecA-like ATPase